MLDDLSLGLELPTLGARVSRRKKPAESDPEERRSLLGKLGDSALSGLSMVGNVLDVPGSMVRDAIGGENPFDQLMSPHSDRNRLTGRDLLRRAGVVGKKDTWGNWGAGLATEVALDPTTYLTFGASALTKGGKVAKAAGLLDDAARVAARRTGTELSKVGARTARTTTTLRNLVDDLGPEALQKARDFAGKNKINLDDVMDEKLGGLVGIGLPFSDPIKVFGTGARGQAIAKGLDTAGRAVRYAKIPGTDFQPLNTVARLFDARLKDTTTPEGQAAAKTLFGRQEKNAAKVGLDQSANVRELDALGLGKQTDAPALRSMLEDPTNMTPFVTSKRTALADKLKRNREWGINTQEYIDPAAAYFPVHMTEGVAMSGKAPKEPFSTMTPNRIGRREFLFGIKDRSNVLHNLSKDVEINKLIDGGADRKRIADEIQTRFGSQIPATYFAKDAKARMLKTGLPAKPKDRYAKLAGWLSHMPKELREAGLFGNHPINDLAKAERASDDAFSAAQTVLETLAQPGFLKAGSAAARVEGTETVGNVLRKLSMFQGDEAQGALTKLAELQHGPAWKAIVASDPKSAAIIAKDIANHRIPQNIADDITRMVNGFTSPEPVSQIVKLYDSVTNLTKGMLTGPWPAFHTRNLVSGQFQNFIAGMFSPGSVKDAHGMIRGGTVQGAASIPALQKIASERGLQFEGKGLPELIDTLQKHGNLNASDAALVGKTWQAVSEGLGEDLSTMQKSVQFQAGGSLDPKALKQAPAQTPPNIDRAREVLQRIPKASAAGLAKQLGDVTESQAADLLKQIEAEKVAKAAPKQVTLAALNDAIKSRPIASHQTPFDVVKEVLKENGLQISDSAAHSKYKADELRESVRLLDSGEPGRFGVTGDAAYRMLLSTGSRKTLKKGETWRGEVMEWINHEDKKWTDAVAEAIKGKADKLYQTDAGTVKGATTFAADGKALIQSFRGADVSTHLHEMSHVLRRRLAEPDQDIANAFVGAARGAAWTIDQEEKWARGFENYVRTQEAPSSAIAAVWEKLKQAMTNIYRTITGSDIDVALTPEIKELYSRLVGSGPKKGKFFNDETATQLLRDLAYAYRITGKGELDNAIGKLAGEPATIDAVRAGMPGEVPYTLKGVFKGATANPLDIRGVGGRTESKFAPAKAGDALGHYVEGLNRLAPFIEQLKKGVDPAEAAKKIGAAQVLYQNKYYTKMEQEVLKRLFPFYSFTSRQLPFTLQQLSEKPGGRMAQTIRAANRARNPDEFTPDYVSETASIGLGKAADGTARYLTGLGLSMEDPLSLVGSPRGAGLEVLSRLNPIVKAPLEYATGEAFFQKGPEGGRNLSDMDPTIGRLLANVSGRKQPVKVPFGQELDVLVNNSPLSRVASTARVLTDNRKGVLGRAANLGTGFKVTDVSPGAQDAVLRERAQALEKKLGFNEFTRLHLPEEERAGMGPLELQLSDELLALDRELALRAKQRKAERVKSARQ